MIYYDKDVQGKYFATKKHVTEVMKKEPAFAVGPMTADSAKKAQALKMAMLLNTIINGVVVHSVSHAPITDRTPVQVIKYRYP